MCSMSHHTAPPSALALAVALVTAVGLLVLPARADAQSLRGSRSSLERQVRQAAAHDYTYLTTPAQVARFVRAGRLVRVAANAHYRLEKVSFPYARPEVELFLQRLGAQFHAACGERLVVTSLTRPRTRQPRNASPRSVHPTGMAVDLRRHNEPACRSWLERVLLSLERRGVLEATLEHHPPHYHVALFPRPYLAYVRSLQRSVQASVRDLLVYRVAAGDTLWSIARRHGTTPEQIRRLNGLASELIRAGQTLHVPAPARAR